ncbi:PREDICTED: uncharacterized protein LOC108978848 [Bactrocera latifrons]|uniref:Uncharacterized protein n=1 Tax=Bactrocera latifrons TaxID=174628 RepID=A0A0K8VUD0_BACLA|nr:PREDICTED: uncharacterized protein LOC108978848 [Bactrocera latifrons]
MQTGIYKQKNTGSHSDINPTFSPGNELVAFNSEKINYLCEGVDLILKDRHKWHGDRGDWDVQNGNQVKWSRNNITATMERFEPIGDPLPPPPSSTFLDYGLAATVVAAIKKETDDVQIVNPFNGTSKDFESLGAVGSVDHVYSYAYYEPRVMKCNSNISQKDIIEKCKNEHISSRQNESKGFRFKASCEQKAYLCLEDHHSYTTHYGTTENLYEEVNEKNVKHVLCDNNISISAKNVKEEILQVQRNHFRVIEELNLSLETFIMPPNLTPNNIEETAESIVHCGGAESDLSSTVETSNKLLNPKRCKSGLIGGPLSSLSISDHRRKISSTSLEDIVETFQSMDVKDNSQNSSNNVEFDEEDLDSGFSGSVISSGASYNESLRYNKSRGAPQTRSNAFSKSSCCSSPPSNEFSIKNNVTSQQSTSVTNKRFCENFLPRKKGHEITPFNSSHRYSDMHHLYIRSTPEALSTGSKSGSSF